MSFGRSASGPGGLSINTGAANLFGGTSTTTQAPAAGGGLFGGNTTTSQPQPTQSTSLFGAPTSQPQNTGSLFGNTAANSQPQQQSGGMFGGLSNIQTTAQQPQQTATALGSSLFGQTAAAQPQQQQGGPFGSGAATTGGGLFGNSTTTTQQPQQMGSLFGSNAAAQPQQEQQQQQQQNIFGGAPTTQTQPAQGGGLFGQPAQQQQPQQQQQQQPQQQAGTNLLGSLATNVAPGGGLFGGLTPTSTNAQVVPGVRIDVSNLTFTTRFNDLQEDLQKEITRIDEGIQACIRSKEAVDAFLPAHAEQIAAISPDVSFVTRKSEGALSALEGDVVIIDQLRDFVKKDAENAKLSWKAIDNLKLPSQYHQAGLWSTRGAQTGTGGSATANAEEESNSDLITYFSKTADDMDDMMKKFARNLGEIEGHLHGVQGNILEQLQRVSAQSKNGSQSGTDERISELANVLRDFEESILKVAGVVGGVKEGVTELQIKDFMGHGG